MPNMPTLAYRKEREVGSLKDVAEAAGMSVRTVKRALSGEGYVSLEAMEKVVAAAEKVQYRPNLAARTLKTGKSSEVAVVLGSIDELHMEKMAGFEQVLRAAGYSVHILFSAERETGEAGGDLMTAIMNRSPAGVALFPVPSVGRRKMVQVLSDANIPYIALDTRMDDTDAVRIDRQAGVQEAVSYLAEQGRKRIAYVGPTFDRSRLDGYEAAMKMLGMDPIIVAVDRLTPDGVKAATDEMLAMDSRPDAIQTYSDVVAMGLLSELHEQGVPIPEDIAVIGFDDRHCAALAWPALTTVAQPNREVGALAAEILLEKIAGNSAPEDGWTRSLPTRLIVRDSA